MSGTYSIIPVNFNNLTINRTPEEAQENAVMLSSCVNENALKHLNKFLEHNNLEYSDNLYLQANKYECPKFFNNENLEKFQKVVTEFREDKYNNNLKEKYKDINLEYNSDDSDIQQEPTYCNCNFCNDFRSYENEWNNWKPITAGEKIMYQSIINFK
jgi:hypothetical protein